MSESIFDLIRSFKNEQRERGGEVESITVGNEKVLLDKFPTVPAESPNVQLFGIPVYTDPYMPENCGMMKTPCRHSFYEQQADGGELMHMAKRHTVLFKFEE